MAHKSTRAKRLVVGVVSVILTMVLSGCGVEVPDVRGQDLEHATEALESAGLGLGRISYDAASTEPTWTVVRHSGEQRMKRGSEIDVVLAGPRPVTVPRVTSVSQDDADSMLTAAGLRPIIGNISYHESVPASAVVSQDIEPGSVVTTGSRVVLVVSLGKQPPPSASLRLKKSKVISGEFSPKSVVASHKGQVFLQNMMYRHTISVVDVTTRSVVKTINDSVRLADFGFPEYKSTVKGAPVEAALSADGEYMYVSNYSMYGPGFSRPGDDVGGPGSGVDDSFVYRIPLNTLSVDQVIKVGAVPKFLAATPDGKYLLVSNWISYTVSVVDVAKGKEIKQIKVGRYPRGIAVSPDSRYAYIAVMGSTGIERIDLRDFSTKTLKGIGSSPRHLVMSPDGKYLYATLNGSGQIAKIALSTGKVVDRVTTGSQPRSMTMAADGQSLYVVNYESDSVSKVRTSDMAEIQEVAVGHHPIGITYVDGDREVWVSCYSGSVYVFQDR